MSPTNRLAVGLSIGVLLAGWEVACYTFRIPAYLLPPPHAVVVELYSQRMLLLRHLLITTEEVILGFILGVVSGFMIALAIASSRRLAGVLYPILVITQVVPKIAVAPLLLIWFGYGILPKIAVAALISFFPIVVNTALGFSTVSDSMLALMKVLGASRLQTFRMVRFPHAMAYCFSGLKIAILFSVVGAITGEFVGTDAGLGYLMIIGNTTLDTPLLFAAITVTSALGLALFGVLSLLQGLLSKRHGLAFTRKDELVSSA